MSGFAAERWQRLSPLLDELLDLDAAGRTQRLQSLREQDSALAAELERLLERHDAFEARGYLAAGALAPPAVLAGQAVGAYTLERLLGEGGMGQVWLARRTDGRYEGQVAIKLLRGGLRSAGASARFAAEGRILGRLDQPHIARLLDAGITADGQHPYLVLEYVDGEPIDRYVERLDLPLESRLRLVIDAAEAVAHAHARLILHRDLKPSNMLVRADGQLKLLDFGIAKLLDEPADSPTADLTREAGQAFTPAYAAPEQLRSQEVTTATDVYALGVLLYQLLGGSHPTAEGLNDPLERAQATVEREPRRLSDQVKRRGGAAAARLAHALRGDIDTIVARALAKRPADRYAGAAELAEDLRRTLAHEPIAARPDHWLYRSAKFVRRHRVGTGAAALVLLAVVGGASVALLEAREARAQRSQAEGLVEFMLGDLRKRLQPLGRLDALDVVGERALAYYAAQDAARLDADSLGRRARALHLIGEIAERRGQLAEAARRFESASFSTAELLARAPADGQRIYDHAQSEYWVGFIARRRGELAQAEAAMEQYLALATRLHAQPGAAHEWLLELPFAQQNLGVIRLERGSAAEALPLFDASARELGRLATTRPEVWSNQAVAFGWLARAREHLGQLDAALAVQEQKLAALNAAKGSDGRDDSNSRYLRGVAMLDIARLQLALGRHAESVEAAAQATLELDALVERDPSNLDWLGQASFGRLRWAEARRASGDPVPARQACERVGRDLAPMLASDGGKLAWRIKLQGRWLAVCGPLDPGAEMPRALQRYLGTATAATADARRQLDPEQQTVLAEVMLLHGDQLAAAARTDEARAAWRRAAERVQTLASNDLQARAVLAQLRLRLGEVQVAAALSENLEGTSYRHPLLADLRRRLGREGRTGPGR